MSTKQISQESMALLTKRETEVFQFLQSGLTNRQIADKMVVAPGTVKVYVHRILEKLELNSRNELSERHISPKKKRSRKQLIPEMEMVYTFLRVLAQMLDNKFAEALLLNLFYKFENLEKLSNWFFTPHLELSGKTPAETFDSDWMDVYTVLQSDIDTRQL